MDYVAEVSVACPYCGEILELLVDRSVDEQLYTEDCQVCCRPMVVSVKTVGGELLVSLRTEDD